MHGRGTGEEGKRDQHMRTGLARFNSVVAATVDVSSSSSSISPPNSFYKDGCKISIGDCALFKPPQDSPPFIGIIRWLTTGKENKLKLGVNWLYRPADVKLGKGILLEAAPNEIFYSFHRDEIPASSLLHLCKVAFLPKGVELPSGICSFVCRRVYDIRNRSLWWLIDQDYINERQEEVDQLLYKTRIEMHATVQPGGRSPKPMNGATSTAQLKSGSDSVQNTASSYSSQAKGKKRERIDQSSEPVKRERSTKMDDGDSDHSRPESILKSEIAKFTEKGGLADFEGVERLVQLMVPDRNERKIDLVGRSILAGVVAATDKFDCLNQFVLRGLPVFDEWLQEVHKGKIGDGGGSKDSDKSIEEFLLVLLHALDKLPVNLHALQMCNIGKSVNHLRTHKNLEIQKKARGLVDTWKKRVEAEIYSKPGSIQSVPWSARPRLPEVSHGGNRHLGVSSEVATKSSIVQLSTSKATPVKLVQGETLPKSAATSPGSSKSSPSPTSVGNNSKEGQPRNAGAGTISDLPQASTRDEKSSSSSQSHNNSQSCSSDFTKAGGWSGKEDTRGSTAGSMNVTNIVGGSLRHRKSINGFPGAAPSVVQRENRSSRSSSLHRNPASEKLSQSGLICEKTVDAPIAEGNNQKLIVKIPNRGRSPAQTASAGSFEDPSAMNSRDSSPVIPEKHDQFDRDLKEKNDVYRANVTADVNTESWQCNDFKEVLIGSEGGDGSPDTPPDEEHSTGDDSKKLAEVAKAASSSSANEHKSGKLHEVSFGSINALIETCVKYSEANASMSAGDDMGMNLLASVAAGEMSKSDMVSPTGSPQRNTPVIERSYCDSDSRLKFCPGDSLARNQCQSVDGVDNEHEKRGIVATSLAKNTDGKTGSFSQELPAGDCNENSNSSPMNAQQASEQCIIINAKMEELSINAPVAVPSVITAGKTTSLGGKELQEEKASSRLNVDSTSDTNDILREPSSTDDKVNISGIKAETKAAEESLSHPSSEINVEDKKNMNEEFKTTVEADQKSPAMIHSEFAKGSNGEVLPPSSSCKAIVSENVDEVKATKAEETDGSIQSSEKEKTQHESNTGSALADHKGEYLEVCLEGNEVNGQHSSGPAPLKVSPVLKEEPEQQVRPRGSKLSAAEAKESISATTDAASLFAAAGSNMEAKVEFDLNEGFSADDGKYGEPNNLKASGSSSAVQLISLMPLPVSSVSAGLPASITVAAAAKRPFVPPEDLLKSRGELGWKGSAATSAFRPAETRKVSETSVSATNIYLPDVTTAAKACRPPLDIDLNVPDERILYDLASRNSTQGKSVSDHTNNAEVGRGELIGSIHARSSGGLDLDLNQVDEPTDTGNPLISNGCRVDIQPQPVKSFSGGPLKGEVRTCRDFDLNDGPSIDDVGVEPSSFGEQTRNTAPTQLSVSGLRINNTEMGNFSSWFPRANPYQAVTIQSILPERDQHFPLVAPGGPQRMLAPPAGSMPFNPDVYRGAVLSSSPAVPFPSTPFQYSFLPFGTNFPLPSASFSGGSTPYVDSSSGGRLCFPALAATVPSHYPRSGPYVVSFPDGSNNGGTESSRKWGMQGLDLNAGPLGPDIDGRDETSSLASRQLSFAGSQPLAEDQSRMYQMASGSVLKRKEPDGGWQSPWQ